MLLTLISLLFLVPFFAVAYGAIVFFDLVGTGLEYALIGGGVLFALALIAHALHFTFSTLFGKVGEKIATFLIAIPFFAVSISLYGVVVVVIVALLALPVVFLVGVLGVSWQIVLGIAVGIVALIAVLVRYSHNTPRA